MGQTTTRNHGKRKATKRNVHVSHGRKRDVRLSKSASADQVFEIARKPNADIRLAIEHGLPASAVKEVAGRFNLSKKLFSEGVGLSVRTLDRKIEKNQRLSKEESATIVRVAKVRDLAAKLFSSDEAISAWLTEPDSALGGETPLSMLSNEFTAVEVENLLQGLIHGFVA